MHNLRKLLCSLLSITILATTLTSCHKDDEEDAVNERTVFIYMPWTASLYSYFQVNLTDFKKAIVSHGLNRQRVVVFLATSASTAKMFEITLVNGECQETLLKEYSSPAYNTSSAIASYIKDMKMAAPATKSYSMMIGSHGLGWIPVGYTSRVRSTAEPLKYHFEYTDGPLTRFFGGDSDLYRVNITTLAEAIESTGIKMEYILFDDCYMSNIEVAYDLRNATNYLIGCATEVMAYGMPYQKIGSALLGTPDYKSVCQEFYTFYSSYSTPCGTIGVTDCSQVDSIASIMKEINASCTFDKSKLSSIQDLDGYTPTIFFDFNDYVQHLCTDVTMLGKFEAQLKKTVPYSACTSTYYSAINKEQKAINTFCGCTISDPTQNTTYASSVASTNWWKATH